MVLQFPIDVGQVIIECPDGPNRASQPSSLPQTVVVRGSAVPPPYSTSSCFHPLTDHIFCTCRSGDSEVVTPLDLLEGSHHPSSLCVIGKYSAQSLDQSSALKQNKITVTLGSGSTFPIQYLAVTIIRSQPLSQSSTMIQLEKILIVERHVTPKVLKDFAESPNVPKKVTRSSVQTLPNHFPDLPSLFPARSSFGSKAESQSYDVTNSLLEGSLRSDQSKLKDSLSSDDPDDMSTVISMALRCLELCAGSGRGENSCDSKGHIQVFQPLKHWIALLLTLTTIPTYYVTSAQIVWKLCCENSDASQIIFTLSLRDRFLWSCCSLSAALCPLPLVTLDRDEICKREGNFNSSLGVCCKRFQSLFERLCQQMRHSLADTRHRVSAEISDEKGIKKEKENEICEKCHAGLGEGCLTMTIRLAKYFSFALSQMESLIPNGTKCDIISLSLCDVTLFLEMVAYLMKASLPSLDRVFFRILSQFVRMDLLSFESLLPKMEDISHENAFMSFFERIGKGFVSEVEFFDQLYLR